LAELTVKLDAEDAVEAVKEYLRKAIPEMLSAHDVDSLQYQSGWNDCVRTILEAIEK
jgi:hypothetical protein